MAAGASCTKPRTPGSAAKWRCSMMAGITTAARRHFSRESIERKAIGRAQQERRGVGA